MRLTDAEILALMRRERMNSLSRQMLPFSRRELNFSVAWNVA